MLSVALVKLSVTRARILTVSFPELGPRSTVSVNMKHASSIVCGISANDVYLIVDILRFSRIVTPPWRHEQIKMDLGKPEYCDVKWTGTGFGPKKLSH